MSKHKQYVVRTSTRRSKPLSALKIKELFDSGRISTDATVTEVGTELGIPVAAFLKQLQRQDQPKIHPVRRPTPPLPQDKPLRTPLVPAPDRMPAASVPPQAEMRSDSSAAPPTLPVAAHRCPFCAEVILRDAKKCKHCGEIVDPTLRPHHQSMSAGRNKVVAFLLAFFLGLLGVHKFYLGQNGMGAFYLMMNVLFFWTLIVPLVFGVICLIESITYLTYSDQQFAKTYG